MEIRKQPGNRKEKIESRGGKTEGGEDKKRITRREFLTLVVLALLGVLGYKLLPRIIKKTKEEAEEEKEAILLEEKLSEINKRLLNLENNNAQLDYSDLAKEINEYLKNKEISDLTKYYLMEIEKGLEAFVIDNLWEEKINLVEEKLKGNRKEKEERILEFRKFKEILMNEYEELPKGYIKDIEEFKTYLKFCILEVFFTLKLEELLENERFKFDEEKRNLTFQILGDEKFLNYFVNLLLALILNEISNISKDKEINRKMLEYLLRKYGLRFITSIPSIYDIVPSFGPFQLTNLVIGEEKDKFYPINFMNQFIMEFEQDMKKKYKLPDYKLPSNIYGLRLRDHFKAEILLLLFYLLEVFKKINLEILKKFLEKRDWFYKQLIYYLGGAHHLPAKSKELFLEFLSDERNLEYEKGFIDFIEEGDLKKYLEGLRKNFS